MNVADRDSHATGVSTSLDFVCIAHRGMRSHFPENTLSAFKGALDYGCLHFETDAQLTGDGACVLFHDDTLDRTTNGSGKLEEVRRILAVLHPLPSNASYRSIQDGFPCPRSRALHSHATSLRIHALLWVTQFLTPQLLLGATVLRAITRR